MQAAIVAVVLMACTNASLAAVTRSAPPLPSWAATAWAPPMLSLAAAADASGRPPTARSMPEAYPLASMLPGHRRPHGDRARPLVVNLLAVGAVSAAGWACRIASTAWPCSACQPAASRCSAAIVLGRLAPQLQPQQVGEELVVAKPRAPDVDRDDERVGLLELLPAAARRRRGRSGDRRAGR